VKNIPLSTYRLQFCPAFGFKEARETIDYLAELGISCIYASPIFKPRKGSTHGYDLIDSNQLNPELGAKEEYELLLSAVERFGLSWLQDIVPNHMAFAGENQFLLDVLENGPSSRYFHFFDIDWNHPDEGFRGRLLAPFLGKYYGVSLLAGEIRLRYDEAGFSVRYYDLTFPVKIESYAAILTHRLGLLKRKLGRSSPDFLKLLGILGVLYVLKNFSSTESSSERYDQINLVKVLLWELYTRNPEISRFVDDNLTAFNGTPGDPVSMRLLQNLLLEQFYRLSFWKVATEEINYRRFFNINELISLRMEDLSVLDHTHSLVFKLIQEGKITGLRVDHVDGLFDPTLYLWTVRGKAADIYMVVEKILAPDEEIPDFWPVQGTTGYDFMNLVNGIFCEQKNERAFDRIYAGFSGLSTPVEELVFQMKNLIAEKHMAGDVENLALLIKNISNRYSLGSDITLNGLRSSIKQIMAMFPVYRTYLDKDSFRWRDRIFVHQAVKRVKDKNPDFLYELSFIEELLLPEFGEQLSGEERDEWLKTVMRFQQFTGPLMAKGVEDTVLYVYNRLISLNEVGAEPSRFGFPVRAFHDFNGNAVRRHPHSMKATCTHDTKRGEDVRARINVISELPREWASSLKTWSRLNRKHKQRVGETEAPDANIEYFLYQTLIGALPFGDYDHEDFLGRIEQYILKAAREAKAHTSWLRPSTEYENALTTFVEAILNPARANPFLQAFLPFQHKIALYGIWNSLSQTLLKIACPGVPDFYQGTELWDLSLVDPDNRRPVDFELRGRLLNEIIGRDGELASLIQELLDSREDGRIKLFTIHRALGARRKHPRLFLDGSYEPLRTAGTFRSQVVCFARRHEDCWAIVAAPRLLTKVVKPPVAPLGPDVWRDTRIQIPKKAPSTWVNVFTGELREDKRSLPVGEIFKRFPLALFIDAGSATAGTEINHHHPP
jgi:(1->4)-alpha-D-glucan 1-alpha-D-glucosylmutase